jgi:hypothetical protein
MLTAIAVSATKSYLHAFPQCIRSIATASAHLENAHFIFTTDESEESKQVEELLKGTLPPGWDITTIRLKGMNEDSKDYLPQAQLRIAALQGAALGFARCKLKADRFWSVESDNIVPANALRMLEWTLNMPQSDGSPYYHVAAATYPNGLFLGGFGTYQTLINEDFLPHERILPKRLKLCHSLCDERLRKREGNPEKEMRRMDRLRERIKQCPPDGNIWEVTAKHGWRQRGWMDFAYPGIGEGAIVPSDWCGMGCTLLSKQALALSDFSGYDGRGTQDLFLCWQCWHPAGLRIACVPHVVCDHVKQEKEGIVHYRAYHEQDPAFRGHLRVRRQPWVPT